MDQPTAQPQQLQIQNAVYEHDGAIVFDGSQIESLRTAQEPCIIFYLTEEDEKNSFGTVIRLDPQTKQTAIFPDLNPEYTYLFYKDGNGQLQTLLRCIEFASRTETGQFIAHAKIYGDGIDLEALSQNAESATTSQSTSQPVSQTPTLSAATSPLYPAQAVEPTPSAIAGEQVFPYTPTPTTTPAEDPAKPPIHHLSLPPQPVMVNTTDPGPVPPPPALDFSQPSLAATTPATPQLADLTPQANPLPEPPPVANNLQPTPNRATAPAAQPNPLPMDMPLPTPPANQPSVDTLNNPAPQANTDGMVTLPGDNPATPAADSVTLPMAQPARSPLPAPLPVNAPSMPESQTSPTIATDPSASSVPPIPAQPEPTNLPPLTSQAADQVAKNPVGRPPKPLIQDSAWLIEPDTFSWLKTMSRQPIASFKEELYEKMVHQIRANQPDLVDNWHFNNKLEQAFNAICATYDLVPTSRQDILRSLLNGRIVNQVHQQLETGVQ